MQPSQPRHAWRPQKRVAFTILELLVTVSILGIALAMLLPAIGAAREASRRIQCVSHLREIGIALHHHHDAKRSLPVGWAFEPSSQSAYGWTVPLLPFLEQPALFDAIDPHKAIGDPAHAQARRTSLEIMLCPSDIAESAFALYAMDEEDEEHGVGRDLANHDANETLVQLPTANYVGVFGTLDPDDAVPAPIGDGAFLENRSVRFRDFARGLSNTLVVGERTMAQVPSTWLGVALAGEDAAARLVGSALEGVNHPLADECDFSSRHPGGANFLWGDGHLSFVTESVDLRLYHQWSQLRMPYPHAP
ncbi:hypothetical protein Pla52o_41970 [Novipirellula galeiformis]|uniref:DUF1559 domain-containing protein n=1 Tax=Novipirellula galeiformis TaxID=2528004 RepID=A0A5C6C8Y2_9BACT|nr:DUF1559 domain-containing protein [Novipirellula galeiformis]TWU21163.1 hypothetical protein Pla52o_41970 [Novipirellula galeiformis]